MNMEDANYMEEANRMESSYHLAGTHHDRPMWICCWSLDINVRNAVIVVDAIGLATSLVCLVVLTIMLDFHGAPLATVLALPILFIFAFGGGIHGAAKGHIWMVCVALGAYILVLVCVIIAIPGVLMADFMLMADNPNSETDHYGFLVAVTVIHLCLIALSGFGTFVHGQWIVNVRKGLQH